MRITPHRTQTPLALAILQLLHERDLHPYEMQQLIRDRYTDHVIKVRPGSLYHTVERLHRTGLIEPVETARAGRRPARTLSASTDTGRDDFADNLRDLVRYPEDEHPPFAATVVMLSTLGADVVAELLDQRTVSIEAAVAANDQVLASLTKQGVPRAHTMVIEYTQAVRRAELAWVRELIDDIRSGALAWTGQAGKEQAT